MTTETLFKKDSPGYTEFQGNQKLQIVISHASFLFGDCDCSKSMFLVSFLNVFMIRWNQFNYDFLNVVADALFLQTHAI